MEFLLEPPSSCYTELTGACSSPSSSADAFALPPSLQCTVDIVLKSRDGAEFRVHKTQLAIASPVFESMLLMPYASGASLSSTCTPAIAPSGLPLPVVDLSESADVIHLLLTCIYPVPRPLPTSLRLLSGALRAASKYDIPSALSTLRKDLSHPSFLSSDPLHVYGIACTHGFTPEALLSARATLGWTICELVKHRDSMEDMLAADFVQLLRMRVRIEAHMQAVLNTLTVSGSLARKQYGVPVCHRSGGVQTWVRFWVKDVLGEIGRRPVVGGLFEHAGVVRAMEAAGGGCKCCPASAQVWEPEGMRRLKEALEGHAMDFLL